MSLEVTKLNGGYGQVPVLHDVSFNVPDGQVIGLIGLNGAGKSTTIKHIIGLLQPQSGSVTVNGYTLLPMPAPTGGASRTCLRRRYCIRN